MYCSWGLAAVSIPLLKGMLAFFCVFVLFFGVLFLFSPETIAKLSRWGNRILAHPRDEVDNNVALGLVMVVFGLIIAGILMVI